ncbi:MAG: TrkH family potassium uptake protein [Cyanobacteria bacterium P01_G01_bin.38]
MKIQLAAISHDVGKVLQIPAGMLLLSLPVCLVAQEWFALVPFMATLLGTIAVSQLLQFLGRKAKTASQGQTLISVALGWALVSGLGALPLWLTAFSLGADASPTMANFGNGLNALFESFSGFTSAGLTMTLHPSELPVSLQWWRSFMQWVGGVGVITLAIALLEPNQGNYELYQAEGRQAHLRLTISRTVRRIWFIYLGCTVAGTLLFLAVGMSGWAALNHSMSALSTGGFSITDDSMKPYSAPIKLAIMLMMVCGAIAFNSLDQIIERRQLSALWRDHQHRLLAVLLALGIGLIGLEQFVTRGQFEWIDSAFQWTSALTTCGFSTQSLQSWSSSSKLMLSLAMVLGGAAGSTVGGLKLSRVLLLGRVVTWQLQKTLLSPRQLLPRRYNGRLLTPEQANRQVEEATVLAALWITSIFISVLILLKVVPAEYSLGDIIFEVSSALGAAGLSTGITSPSLHWIGKCLLIVLMWMGRLEIIPILMLIGAPCSQLIRLIRK